jgi:AcrR family transcriptional regulator
MLTEQTVIKGRSQRSLQKERTQRRILDAARSLYTEHGITATRSAAVAEAAGVAHGTLFLHFSTQEALVIAVIEDFGENLCRRLHELSLRDEGLEAMLKAHVAGLRENEELYTRLVTEAPLLPEVARMALVGIQSTLSFHIARAAEEGMASGAVKRQPIPLFFNTWLGLLHYYLANRELFAPEGGVLERYGDTLVGFFLELVSGESSTKSEPYVRNDQGGPS